MTISHPDCNMLCAERPGVSVSNPSHTEPVESLARRIRLLVLDVDGVLTDGGLYYDEKGLAIKRFHVHDGIGIRLAKSVGIEVAVLSGMDVPCVARRMEVLGITEYYGGYDAKRPLLDGIRKRHGLQWNEIAYLGDDWVDLSPMLLVGLPAAVANALPEVREAARYITKKNGGNGAVREFTDFLLTCQGKREALLESWKHLE